MAYIKGQKKQNNEHTLTSRKALNVSAVALEFSMETPSFFAPRSLRAIILITRRHETNKHKSHPPSIFELYPCGT